MKLKPVSACVGNIVGWAIILAAGILLLAPFAYVCLLACVVEAERNKLKEGDKHNT